MTGPVPSRHHDIADDLRHQITTGSKKPGERLPSEVGLADRYKVSTVTLRRALAVLQGEGLIEKIHGKGNYVRRPRRKIMYVGGWGTLDPWTAAEPTLRVTVRSTTVPASVPLTTLLKVPTGSPLAEYSCLSLEQGSPHGLARIYIPRDLTPAGVLDDDSVCREAATRFAVLGPSPATIRETASFYAGRVARAQNRGPSPRRAVPELICDANWFSGQSSCTGAVDPRNIFSRSVSHHGFHELENHWPLPHVNRPFRGSSSTTLRRLPLVV
ncbi:GntR family transcriptional regulator [Streptomyces sp. NBC_01511]|uniref:GntR family transcriptional regulator n=1 Tax=Streptomyces sp. NBC_01511 TaxID=2903889 RepID=UPI00386C240C